MFNTFLVIPLTNLLVALYHGFVLLGVPYALGFSIIAVSVLIRLILYPITASQLKMSKKMQEINPHLATLKEKHKDDPKKLQQETMQLYSQHGVNPLAGCLPTLLQFIVLIGLFQVIKEVSNDPQTVLKHINSVLYFNELKLHTFWDTTFFGLPLVSRPAQLLGTVGPLILLVPLVTAILQFLQSAMMSPVPGTQPKTSSDSPMDMTAAMSNMMYVLPVTIGIFAFNSPLALSLYWNTFSIFGIIQQYRVAGLGKLGHWNTQLRGKQTTQAPVIEAEIVTPKDSKKKTKKKRR